ncbi:hypothetical protein AVEN_17111-1, partial [Araneus ventricosus]
MERRQFSRISTNPHSQHRRLGAERNHPAELLRGMALHAVQGFSAHWEIPHAPG